MNKQNATLTKWDMGLKILSFVNTGVPVQVRPGALFKNFHLIFSPDSLGKVAVYGFFPSGGFGLLPYFSPSAGLPKGLANSE